MMAAICQSRSHHPSKAGLGFPDEPSPVAFFSGKTLDNTC